MNVPRKNARPIPSRGRPSTFGPFGKPALFLLDSPAAVPVDLFHAARENDCARAATRCLFCDCPPAEFIAWRPSLYIRNRIARIARGAMTRNRQNYVTFGLCSTHTQYRTKFTRLEERLIADLDMVRPEGVEPVSTWHVIPDPKEQAEPDVFPRGAPHSLAERAAFWHGMGRK